jgi:hypothetical protein
MDDSSTWSPSPRTKWAALKWSSHNGRTQNAKIPGEKFSGAIDPKMLDLKGGSCGSFLGFDHFRPLKRELKEEREDLHLSRKGV